MPMARCSTNSVISAPTRVEARTASAGFTILELLIVIGMVISLAAIAIPFTLQELERRTEAEATDRLGLLVRLGRAEARASGMPMEVMCDPSGTRVMVLRVDPRNPGVILVSDDGDELGAGSDPEPGSERRIRDRWATVRFEAPVTVSPVPRSEVDEAGEFEFEVFEESEADTGPIAEDGSDPWPDSTRLLLLLPDGSVITVTPFGLNTAQGRRSISVDPFSGRMRFSEEGTAEVPSVPGESEEPSVENELESDLPDDLPDEGAFGPESPDAVDDEGGRI